MRIRLRGVTASIMVLATSESRTWQQILQQRGLRVYDYQPWGIDCDPTTRNTQNHFEENGFQSLSLLKKSKKILSLDSNLF